jgi:hypothetical protein
MHAHHAHHTHTHTHTQAVGDILACVAGLCFASLLLVYVPPPSHSIIQHYTALHHHTVLHRIAQHYTASHSGFCLSFVNVCILLLSIIHIAQGASILCTHSITQRHIASHISTHHHIASRSYTVDVPHSITEYRCQIHTKGSSWAVIQHAYMTVQHAYMAVQHAYMTVQHAYMKGSVTLPSAWARAPACYPAR